MVDRVFGPSVSPGVPISAGSTVKFRVRQVSGSAQTLSNVRFGIMQVEPQGQGLVALPSTGDGGGGPEWASEKSYMYTGASNTNDIRAYDEEGTLVWTANDPTGAIYAVAVDPDGNVYSASDDFSVRKFDSDGTQLWSYVGHGINVYSVAVGLDGKVYSSSFSAGIRAVDSDGAELWTNTTPGTRVDCVAVDFAGNVYAGAGNGRVYKLDPAGDIVWTHVAASPVQVDAVAVDPDGNVYFGQPSGTDRGLTKLDSAGDLVWNNDSRPVFDMALDDDWVYTASNTSTSFYRYSVVDGTEDLISSNLGSGVTLQSVAVGPDGFLYTGQRRSGTTSRYQKLDALAAVQWTASDSFSLVFGVAVDPGVRGIFP